MYFSNWQLKLKTLQKNYRRSEETETEGITMRGYSLDIGVTLAYHTCRSQERLIQFCLFSSLFPSLPPVLWTSHPFSLSCSLTASTNTDKSFFMLTQGLKACWLTNPVKWLIRLEGGETQGKMDTKIWPGLNCDLLKLSKALLINTLPSTHK